MSTPDHWGSNVLEAAVDAARRGCTVVALFGVLPSPGGTWRCECGGPGLINPRTGEEYHCNPGKHPREAYAGPESKASADPAVVAAKFRRWPRANYGIVMGPPSGLFALDVDPRNGGDQTLVDLVREHGPLGDTLHAWTGSGGDHYLLRWPGQAIVNGAHKLGRGLDVKGAESYIVGAGSKHISGHLYRWAPGAQEPLHAPPWLLAMLTPAPEPEPVVAPVGAPRAPAPGRPAAEVRAADYLRALPSAVEGQGGAQAMFTAASRLVRGFELSAEVALELILREFNPRALPPWSKGQLGHLRRIVDAAARSTSSKAMPRGALLARDSGAWLARGGA